MEDEGPTRCLRVSGGDGAGWKQGNTPVTLPHSLLCTIPEPQTGQPGAFRRPTRAQPTQPSIEVRPKPSGVMVARGAAACGPRSLFKWAKQLPSAQNSKEPQKTAQRGAWGGGAFEQCM